MNASELPLLLRLKQAMAFTGLSRQALRKLRKNRPSVSVVVPGMVEVRYVRDELVREVARNTNATSEPRRDA